LRERRSLVSKKHVGGPKGGERNTDKDRRQKQKTPPNGGQAKEDRWVGAGRKQAAYGPQTETICKREWGWKAGLNRERYQTSEEKG